MPCALEGSLESVNRDAGLLDSSGRLISIQLSKTRPNVPHHTLVQLPNQLHRIQSVKSLPQLHWALNNGAKCFSPQFNANKLTDEAAGLRPWGLTRALKGCNNLSIMMITLTTVQSLYILGHINDVLFLYIMCHLSTVGNYIPQWYNISGQCWIFFHTVVTCYTVVVFLTLLLIFLSLCILLRYFVHIILYFTYCVCSASLAQQFPSGWMKIFCYLTMR